MRRLAIACLAAFGSLSQPGVLWHLIWPGLLSAAVSIPLLIGGAVKLGEMLAGQGGASIFGLPAMGQGGYWLAGFAMVLLAMPVIHFLTTLLVAVVGVPLMLTRVAARDYGDLEKMCGAGWAGSLAQVARASGTLLLLGLLCLPLWFVPVIGFFVPPLLAGWFVQQTLAFDALMEHASAEESHALRRAHRVELLGLGVGSVVLAFVPVLNFFVPAFTGLVFIHYCLEALRAARAQQPQGEIIHGISSHHHRR